MNDVFYKDGLRFSCQKCGKCCRIPNGIVHLTEKDIERIAEFFDSSLEEIFSRFTHREQKYRVLNELLNGDCIFFREGKGCIIYSARPEQCRTFPFWRQNLRSQIAWDSAASECPGMNSGKLYSFDEIEKIAQGEVD